MIEIPVYNVDAKEIGKFSIEDSIFSRDVNLHSLWFYRKMYLVNQRQGTASTKTRSEVRGSNSKPWKQKGTGRARAGTKKSPIWRGGGKAHGPKPRDFRDKMPVKVKRLAFYSALKDKLVTDRIFILENSFEGFDKTRLAYEFLLNLNSVEKTLFITDKNLSSFLGVKNIPNASLEDVQTVNAYQLGVARTVILTESSMDKIIDRVKLL